MTFDHPRRPPCRRSGLLAEDGRPLCQHGVEMVSTGHGWKCRVRHRVRDREQHAERYAELSSTMAGRSILWEKNQRDTRRRRAVRIVLHLFDTTGIAGLTLGGGIGYLIGAYALTLDNLVSVRMATLDGEIVNASAENEEELFWALRGGGGNAR